MSTLIEDLRAVLAERVPGEDQSAVPASGELLRNLRDHLADATPLVRNVLYAAAEAGATTEDLLHEPGRARLARRLTCDWYLGPDRARWATDTWAVAAGADDITPPDWPPEPVRCRRWTRGKRLRVALPFVLLVATLGIWAYLWWMRPPELIGHDGAVLAIAVSPDGRHAVSVGADGKAIWWDLAHRRAARQVKLGLTPKEDVSLSLGRGECLLGMPGEEGWWVKGEDSVVFRDHPGAVASAVAVAGAEAGVPVWAVRRATGPRVLTPDSHVRRDRQLSARPGPAKGGRFVAVSPDGKLLAEGGAPQEPTVVWDLEKVRPVRELEAYTPGVACAAFSTKADLLATGDRAGVVRVWRMDTGRQAFAAEEHRTGVLAVAFSADGKLLYSVDSIQLNVHRVSDGLRVGRYDLSRELRLGTSVVTVSAALDVARGWMLAGGSDGIIRVWSLPKP